MTFNPLWPQLSFLNDIKCFDIDGNLQVHTNIFVSKGLRIEGT